MREDRSSPDSFEEALRQSLRNAPFLFLSAVFHGLVLLLAWLLYDPRPSVIAHEAPIIAVVRERVVDPIEVPPPEPIPEPTPLDVNEQQIDDPLAQSNVEGTLDHETDAPDDGRNEETQKNDSHSKGDGFGPEPGDSTSSKIGVGHDGGAEGGGHHARFGGPRGPGSVGGRASQKSIDHALTWLARHQDDDGHWSAHDFADHCSGARCTGDGEVVHDVGVSGLALLALLGCGNTSTRGPFHDNVKRGLHYLAQIQDHETGCFGQPNSHESFLYDHAIATLAMTEGFGLSRTPLLKAPAQRGLEFIAMARNPYKAWRYSYPPSGENDLSVTGWMVMALTSGQDFGLNVDPSALDGARVLIDELTDDATGRAGYVTKGGLSSRQARAEERWPASRTESMTAVALLCRVFLGEDPEQSVVMRAGAERLLKQLPQWDEKAGTIDFYYWYYGSYAMYQLGGNAWEKWQRKLLDAVVKQQRTDGCEEGSWDPQVDPWGAAGGRVYSTAIMALSLEAYYRYDRVVGARVSEAGPRKK